MEVPARDNRHAVVIGDRAMVTLLVLFIATISGFSVVRCVTDPSDGKVLFFMSLSPFAFTSFW